MIDDDQRARSIAGIERNRRRAVHIERHLVQRRRAGERLAAEVHLAAVQVDPRPALCAHTTRHYPASTPTQIASIRAIWTAPGSLEAVTSGKVGVHGVQKAASR